MKVAFTYQRIASYLIDIIIIGLLATLLTFWIPKSETYKNAEKQQSEIADQYKNGLIDASEYIDKTYENRYTMDKEEIPITLVTIVITFAYFATFAYYNGGKTLGKKFMRIKIVNEDGKEANQLQLAIRALLINEVFTTLVSLIILLMIQKNQYMYTVGLITFAQMIFTTVSLIMILVRKDKKGLHDLICKTKVVQE